MDGFPLRGSGSLLIGEVALWHGAKNYFAFCPEQGPVFVLFLLFDIILSAFCCAGHLAGS